MSETKKSGLKLFEKLKRIKHIEIYIAIIFIVIILLIYLSSTQKRENSKEKIYNNSSTIEGYVNNLEENLEEILSDIKGVSNVNVMITLDMNKATIKDSNIILDKFPQIKGVVITAKGVNDTSTKMKVMNAVQTVIDITNGRIEILSRE